MKEMVLVVADQLEAHTKVLYLLIFKNLEDMQITNIIHKDKNE